MEDEPPVTEMLEVAASTVPLLERARALVEILDRWLPSDAVWLTLSDPASHAYATVGSAPGRRGGLEVPLCDPGGPYVGMLSLLSAHDEPPSPALRERLGQLAPLIARGVSPMRSLRATASLVTGATAGVVLVSDGATYPLPGLRDHPLLGRDAQVVDVARRMLQAGQVYRTFMWPADDGPGLTGHARMTVLAAHEVPSSVQGTLLVTPEADCRGLTPRELEVLGLVVEGRSNQQIARRLSVALRTVASHMEHILHKLEVPTRTLAAVRAEREGCHVPPRPGLSGQA